MSVSTTANNVVATVASAPNGAGSVSAEQKSAQIEQAHKLMEGIEKPEQDVRRKPDFSTGRPPGDTRTAEQIIDDNPILKNLGNEKDINRSLAYKLLGDWTSQNPDPDARADAAFNAARVLNYIDTSLSATGQPRGKSHDNGVLEGITSSGDARRGTPAGMWKDFTQQGYTALRDDHRLDKTNDSYVREDGTVKDEFRAVSGLIGRNTWFIPGLSNVLNGVSNSEPGIDGAIEGARVGFDKTRADGFDKAIASAVGGDVKGAVEGYIDTLRKNDSTPQVVRSALDSVRT